MAPFAFVRRWFLTTARLADQGDGAVQTGEAAGTTAIAGIHIDVDAISSGLDCLLGAGIFTEQAVEALPGLTALLNLNPGLHLTTQLQVEGAGGTGPGAAAAVAALAEGEIEHRGAGDRGVVVFGLAGRFEQTARAGLETLATAGTEGEVLGLLDRPRRARFMANHGGLARSLPTLCQPTEEIMSHAHPLYLLGVNFSEVCEGRPENSSRQDRKRSCPCVS